MNAPARARTTRRAVIRLLGLITALPLSGGCGIDFEYLLPVIVGQAEILLGAVPIGQAIANGNLAEEEKAKLVLIRDVRDYAGREMGLNTADNFTLFYDAGDAPVAFNVSASHQYEFHAKKWEFPVVGVVPYLGFFDRAAAVREFNELTAQNYDAFMYEVDAYSTLDYFPNPILSPMLGRSDPSLIDTVFHELLHSTVWHATDTTFNESLATFVGRTGALDYVAARFPDEPERVQAAIERYEDIDLYNAFISELYGELDAFYSREGSREEKTNGREAVYQAGRDRFFTTYAPLMYAPENYDWVEDLPTNNAWMLANTRYNSDLDVYERVHAATGRVWRDSLAAFRSAAASANPNAFLREWLAEQTRLDPAQLKRAAAPQAESDHPSGAEPVKRGLCPRTTYLAQPEP